MYKKTIALLVTLCVTCAIIIDGYLLFFKKTNSTTTATTAAKPAAKTTTASGASSASANTSQIKDGTYTGKATSTEWGDVQVQIVVRTGKIATINVLEQPSGGRSDGINAQALPVYKKEALSAQSAKIQQISGATETYKGFTGSLQSAITKAEV